MHMTREEGHRDDGQCANSPTDCAATIRESVKHRRWIAGFTMNRGEFARKDHGMVFALEKGGLIRRGPIFSFARSPMNTMTKSLLSMTANDLMSRDLVLIPHAMSLRSAARLLSRSRVTGAPVVDAAGRCVGVLSATDFVHCVEKEEHARRKRCEEPVYYSAWQLVEPDSLPLDSVAEYMTSDVVTAPPSVSIVRLAQMMLDAHLHRIVIVNESEKPIGIVSSTDILGVVAQAEDREARATGNKASEAAVRGHAGEGPHVPHRLNTYRIHASADSSTAT
jgi:CBS domain-containing protein